MAMQPLSVYFRKTECRAYVGKKNKQTNDRISLGEMEGISILRERNSKFEGQNQRYCDA